MLHPRCSIGGCDLDISICDLLHDIYTLLMRPSEGSNTLDILAIYCGSDMDRILGIFYIYYYAIYDVYIYAKNIPAIPLSRIAANIME